MKKLLLVSVCQIFAVFTQAQMDIPSSGGNPRATLSEEVGITNITIKYSRPDVNGREGKIWGTLVPYGFNSGSFITSKNTAPWRAGANENTTISFENDVVLQGKPVKAGTYGLHMAVWPDSVLFILSSKTDAWGSFYYEEKYDVLRVSIKPIYLEKSVEWLKYEFIEHKEKYAVIAMQWEKLSIPFKIEVNVDSIVIERLRQQVTSMKGFNSNNMMQAAQYCLNKNINLEEALSWSIRAINGFQGQKSYITLRNLAVAYEKLNRTVQADSTMAEALTIATANQYTAYGKILIGQKRVDKALEVFLASKKRYGDIYGVNNGLMFGYSAKGDFKKAINFAEKAMAQAPNETAKKQVEANIVKLKDGKDINQ